MAKILVVDDEPRVRAILKIMLTSAGHHVAEAGDGNEALSVLETDGFDMVISDIRMEGMDGKGLLAEIKKREMGCPVVFITAYATLESAVEALHLGAVDYLVKPFEEKQVHLAVERAIGVGRIMAENLRLKTVLGQECGVEEGVFASAAMQQIRDMAVKVAASETTVMITGESGVGKEVVARLIHSLSGRKPDFFVAVNCAAISPTLLESELFGHEKGAFTGASQQKKGKFEYAQGGTLFLDEVGDLTLEAQAKLLRVIQEKKVQRVGGNQDIPVNIRLLCATNQDLQKLTAERQFRQDLYYRIAVFPIVVPPLRERKDDVIPLAVHFIRKFAGAQSYTGEVLTAGASRILMEYDWPGNVRELANVVERAMIVKNETLPLISDDFAFLRVEKAEPVSVDEMFKIPITGINFEAMQRSIIQQALELSSGNQSAASRMLGITRARFRTLLKLLEYGQE